MKDLEINISNFVWSFKLDSALKNCLSQLSTNVNINRAIIYIYDKKTNILGSELVVVNNMILMGDEEILINPNIDDERIKVILTKKGITKSYYICLPLVIDNEIYGILTVDRSLEHSKFNTKEISFIKKIAKFISSGIYQDRIITERNSRIKQLNALLDISMLINRKDKLTILKYISESLIKYGKFDRVRIYLKQDSKKYICETSNSIIREKATTEKKVYPYSFFKNKETSDIYYISSLAGDEVPLGFIEVDNIISQVKLNEEQINFLKILTTQLSITLNNISLIDKLKIISITDPLTGVYNYRHLMEQLKKEVSRSKRFNLNFSILLIDIDDFKTINDVYGHLTGDEALISLVHKLKEISREIDIISRYGGDEFIIIAPNTDKKKAIEYGNKILSSTPVLDLNNKKTRVKLSIGVSTFPEDSQNITKLIKIADGRLYNAKNGGKNQVSHT